MFRGTWSQHDFILYLKAKTWSVFLHYLFTMCDWFVVVCVCDFQNMSFFLSMNLDESSCKGFLIDLETISKVKSTHKLSLYICHVLNTLKNLWKNTYAHKHVCLSISSHPAPD